MLKFGSSVAGIKWPAIPSAGGASLLALLFQVDRSQWLDSDTLGLLQYEQLALLFEFLWARSPTHRADLEAAGWMPGLALEEAAWRNIPVLTRARFQTFRAELAIQPSPPEHGRVMEFSTNGSLGMPVRGLGNELTHLFLSALVVRNHLWHRRDLSAKFAAIRPMAKAGNFPSWGLVESAAFETGPSAVLDIANDIDRQLDWLLAENPAYLLTHPSNLRALLLRARERGIAIPGLRELSTFGEMLPADLRDLASAVWSLPLVDSYSSEEFGNIALQCPEVTTHYHVQSENLLVEIVDDAGNPCPPGKVGRVLISTLHNFTMPLLRYEIGDYAAFGPPCPCGRGLPVLTRIAGRKRNMLVRADGRRHWPSFPYPDLGPIADYRQIQIVQHDFETLEVRLVLPEPLDSATERAFGDKLDALLHGRFRYRFIYPESLRPPKGGKFEDFISLVDGAADGAVDSLLPRGTA